MFGKVQAPHPPMSDYIFTKNSGCWISFVQDLPCAPLKKIDFPLRLFCLSVISVFTSMKLAESPRTKPNHLVSSCLLLLFLFPWLPAIRAPSSLKHHLGGSELQNSVRATFPARPHAGLEAQCGLSSLVLWELHLPGDSNVAYNVARRAFSILPLKAVY